ncbi:MAG TPA: 4Fe-4S dicluster domain-containing protein [Paracoccaceae bacterium]|nr:4Fe-4S dicluster domain-containing protein [Paracoccaceae bacterium]
MKPYSAGAEGVWFNRVHSYEAGEGGDGRTVHFPRSCLHCADAPCVTVCPTGASYKRAEDGIVLVNEDACIGCGLCAWACPYGAREMDAAAGVMKKCTLCVDRIYNENLPEEDREPACVRTCPTGARHFGDLADPDSTVSRLVADRGGFDLMPGMGTRPVNKYLPPRPKDRPQEASLLAPLLDIQATGFAGWLDRVLGRIG